MKALLQVKCKRLYVIQALLFLFGCLITNNRASSQAPAIQWQKNYGGSASEQAWNLQQTADGGYVMIGSTVSSDIDVTLNHGLSDCWVVKINSTGSIEWQKTYGGSNYETGFCIRQTADGGFVFVGTTWSSDGDVLSNHGVVDIWVVKLNTTGNIEWQKTYGGTSADEAYAIDLTTDGGYIVAGGTQSSNGDVTFNHGVEDYWLIKLNSTGGIQWQKTYGGNNHERAVSVHQTTDGGYIMAGTSRTPNNGDVTGNHGVEDFWVVKTNSVGTLEWQNSYGGDDVENAYSICQTSDGGYIVAGHTYSSNGDITFYRAFGDYWVVKLNSTGSIQWQKTYGGGDFDDALSVCQTPDGGYLVAGTSCSNDGDITGDHDSGPVISDYWLVKLNATGTIEWQKALGGTADDHAFFAQPTADGGYVITGASPSSDGDATDNNGAFDFWTVKLLDAPLPVELISFTGRLNNKTVELSWQTAQEINTSSFVVERSHNGRDFNFLKQINAAGNSFTIRNYKVIDTDPLPNNSFYRLKQIDLDGKFAYSNIVRIFNPSTSFWIHNSQSVKDLLKVQLSSESRSKASLQVIDVGGKVVFQKRITIETGENNIVLPIGHLANGMYVLSLIQDNNVKSGTFLKQ